MKNTKADTMEIDYDSKRDMLYIRVSDRVLSTMDIAGDWTFKYNLYDKTPYELVINKIGENWLQQWYFVIKIITIFFKIPETHDIFFTLNKIKDDIIYDQSAIFKSRS